MEQRVFDSLSYILSLSFLVTQRFLAKSLGDESVVNLPNPDFCQRVLGRQYQLKDIADSFSDTRPLPLGKLFERFAKLALITAYPDYEVTSNIQLQAQETSGELDFVLTKTTSVIHVEVAVKFFLYIPSSTPGLSCFHGPQFKDRLDLKLDRLLQHQLRHGMPPELLRTNDQLSVQRGLWLTGRLFYPWSLYASSQIPLLESLGLNPDHQKGWWLRQNEAVDIFAKHTFLYGPTKHQWIQPWSRIANDMPSGSLSLITQLPALTEPMMVIRLAGDGSEVDRGFLVPNDWGR